MAVTEKASPKSWVYLSAPFTESCSKPVSPKSRERPPDVKTLGALLNQGKVGLTVYYPDAVRGRLIGRLDHALADDTGLYPVARRWFAHDFESLFRFYGNVDAIQSVKTKHAEILTEMALNPLAEVPIGRLFVMVQLTGPALLTLWAGDDACPKLLAKKGKTHPADSAANTVRGSFWCDSSVTNLMHCSDGRVEVERELDALGLNALLDGVVAEGRLLHRESNDEVTPAHCALRVVSDIANRMLQTTHDVDPVRFRLPESGASTETVDAGHRNLESIAFLCPDSPTEKFIEAYLNGSAPDVLNALRNLPATPWERLVVHGGVLTVDRWQERFRRG
jgi:nucleoside diphosphate kinase